MPVINCRLGQETGLGRTPISRNLREREVSRRLQCKAILPVNNIWEYVDILSS